MRALLVPAVLGLSIIVACAATAPAVATPATLATATPSPSSPLPAPSASSSSASETADAGADVAASALVPAAPQAALASNVPAASEPASACNEQAPQDFLIRGNFLKDPAGNARAIQYRTEQYGYFKGFGHAPHDAEPPSAQLVTAHFMGLPVRMHRRVAPALACVEKEIQTTCADHPYTPHALAGIRYRNTYRGGEVTNHAYGIAIDIDPDINTCCGCVPPWNDAPACKRKGTSEYDHMAMPECWVHAFERFGFYWLGHDVLRDTMHFEFLGDPEKILRSPSTPASSVPSVSKTSP
jgi:hypothetical protein